MVLMGLVGARKDEVGQVVKEVVVPREPQKTVLVQVVPHCARPMYLLLSVP